MKYQTTEDVERACATGQPLPRKKPRWPSVAGGGAIIAGKAHKR
jgi:hypothetical protein